MVQYACVSSYENAYNILLVSNKSNKTVKYYGDSVLDVQAY